MCWKSFSVAFVLLASHVSFAHPVIETYEGERPDDVSKVLAPLRNELEKLGNVASPVKLAQLAALPQRGLVDRTVTTTGLRQQVDSAIRDANHGRFDKALATLESVFETVHANPSVVVSDPNAQVWMTKAYVFAAFSQSRLGRDADARETIAEQIRSFPEHPVTTVDFGTEAEQLYGTMRKELDARARGSLLVVVNRPDAQIFINEAGRARGGTFTADVLPGNYRVLVQQGGVALTYAVTIDPSKDRQTELDIDWDIDSAWVSSNDWVGVAWPKGQAKPKELAVRYSKLFKSDGLITISATRHGESFEVTAKAFSKTGDERWSCIDDLDGSTDLAAKELADCVTNGTKHARPSRDPVRREASPHSEEARSRWPAVAAGAISLAALAGGVTLLYLDGNGTCGSAAPIQCEQIYQTKTMGWGAVGVGVVAGALGIYLYVRERPVEIGVRPVGDGGVATLVTSW